MCNESLRGVAEKHHGLEQRRQLSLVGTVYFYHVPERAALIVSFGDTHPFGK
jgi:hypothetical protein